MTPEEFVKSVVHTADTDQSAAGMRNMAVLVGSFYRALIDDAMTESAAVPIACEFVRCLIGDHLRPGLAKDI